ncbi:MAG: hypothetical protein PHE96_02050 [Methylococcales bacterium]|nr:hypothetical protein [Methylococcales bacterium]
MKNNHAMNKVSEFVEPNKVATMVTVKQRLIDWMLPACFSASVAASLELFYKFNHDMVIC